MLVQALVQFLLSLVFFSASSPALVCFAVMFLTMSDLLVSDSLSDLSDIAFVVTAFLVLEKDWREFGIEIGGKQGWKGTMGIGG